MIFWIIAAISAFYIKGLCSFANTLVFTSILSFGSSNINISPVELLLGYPTNMIISYKERKSINWRICLSLATMVVAGSVFGVFFLKNVNVILIKIIFGVIVIAIGVEMLLREIIQKKTRQSKVLLTIIGILSGVLCGIYGVGALLGAYISRVSEDSHGFKANICFVFFIENSFRIILYFINGIITIETLKYTFMLIPFMLAGLIGGMISARFINDNVVKK